MGQTGIHLGPGCTAEKTTNKHSSYWEAHIQEARGNRAGSTQGGKSMARVFKEMKCGRSDPLNLFWSWPGIPH